MKIKSFTKGKNDPKNEDYFGYNENTIVLSDGATDKSGQLFAGRSGGEIISEFIVEKTLKVGFNGVELVRYLSDEIMKLYKDINPKALSDSTFRFAATLICVRIESNKISVTQIGDSAFRINGVDLYKNDKLIDELNAQARSLYIKKTGDVVGGRDYILPLLKQQHVYQNNAKEILGYGVIDGTEVPNEFVKFFEFAKEDIQTIELISDGYFSIPNESTIETYEKKNKEVEQEDPDKWKKYKSTKSKDDRTVVIIDLT